MQELTFETILRLPLRWDLKEGQSCFKSRVTPVPIKARLPVCRGNDSPVLLVAHMDVSLSGRCYSADRAVAYATAGNRGGDDRCGVWMILLILRTANCRCAVSVRMSRLM